ncbi:hypothetical protein [Sphingomonas sp.]|uniref:hypothetical protein n=1 Tax=Sphingomonas sp. TaxID=28214 RepID=UPI0025DA8DEB|nr:hypothetical protein [Sphingomonas sp.]
MRAVDADADWSDRLAASPDPLDRFAHHFAFEQSLHDPRDRCGREPGRDSKVATGDGPASPDCVEHASLAAGKLHRWFSSSRSTQ